MADNPELTMRGGTCPVCHAPSEADATLCEHCLAEGRSTQDAPLPAIAPLPATGPDPAPARPEEAGQDDEGPSLAGDNPLIVATPAGEDDAQQATAAEKATPTEQTKAAGNPPPNEGSDEYFIAKLRQIREAKAPAVVFMGFASAGKTWLVHRFLEQVGYQDDPSRNFSRVTQNEPDGRELAATDYFNFYNVQNEAEPYWLIDTPGEQTRLLMISENKSEAEREQDFQLSWKLIAALHAAAAVVIALPADIVIVGPGVKSLAAKSRGGLVSGIPDYLPKNAEKSQYEPNPNKAPMPQDEKDAVTALAQELLLQHALIDSFVNGIIDAVAAVSLVRSLNLDPLDEKAFRSKITLAAVQAHRGEKRRFDGWGGGARGLDCPTFFALTKADLMICAATDFVPAGRRHEVFEARRQDMLERLEIKALERLAIGSRLREPGNRWLFSHPAELIGAVNQPLHNRLTRAFPLARFDYVTAFFGHDATSKRLKYQDYEGCPPLGVEEMRQWIYEARRLHRRWPFRRWQHRAARWLHMGLNNINAKNTGI